MHQRPREQWRPRRYSRVSGELASALGRPRPSLPASVPICTRFARVPSPVPSARRGCMHASAATRAVKATAIQPRTRWADIALGSAWTMYCRLSTELYAVGSHVIAFYMQPHLHQGYTAKVVDGGLLPTREECKPRRAGSCSALLTVSSQQGDGCMHRAVIQVKVNVLFSIYEFEDVGCKIEYGGIPPKSTSKTAIWAKIFLGGLPPPQPPLAVAHRVCGDKLLLLPPS